MFTEANLFLTSGTSNQESQADKKATTISTTTSPLQKGVIDLMISYKLLIFLRKEKAKKKQELSPLYLRITCEKRTEISLNKWVNPNNWNPEKQCLKGNSPEAKAINSFLKTVEVKFHEIHRYLLDKGELITADGLKSHYLGRTEKKKTVMQVFDYQLSQIKTKIGKGYSPFTLRKYECLKKHITAFIQKNTSADDIFLSKVDLFFIKEFQAYLMTDRLSKNKTGKIIPQKGCDFNAALKYVKMFGVVVNVALAFKWIDQSPFNGFKEKFQDVDQEYLNEAELRQIMDKHITIERLILIRDVFVFCCFTGLAYADVAKLSQEHIVIGMDKRRWIDLSRTKTKTNCKIPLMPVAESILTKYADHPICVLSGKLLPVISNQKYNDYLKEIATICGIEKNLTTHVARRTFATVAADNGIPAETIVKIIGHKGFNHLHLYNKSGQVKISQDMEIFRNKDWGSSYIENPKTVISNAS